MYLDKLYNEIKNYMTTIDGAERTYKAAMDQIKKDYGNTGNIYVQKSDQAKKLYDATREKAFSEGVAVVKETKKNLEKVINEFVTSPVPEDFINTLETLKCVAEVITLEEAEMYMEKYKHNYLASQALANIMFKNNLEIKAPISIKGIKEDLERMMELANKFFRDYNSGEYFSTALIYEQSSLMKYDDALRVFINEDATKYNLE